jgi:SnoaL-like domain
VRSATPSKVRDGAGFAKLFSEDAVYHDAFYGAFARRAKIAELIDDWFYRTARDFRWDMHEPLTNGHTLYARYAFSYLSTLPEAQGRRVGFEGVSIMKLRDGLACPRAQISCTLAPAQSRARQEPARHWRSLDIR